MSASEQEKPAGFKANLERISAAVHFYTGAAFVKLASAVVHHPCTTIAIACVFTIVMAQGVWYYEEEIAGDKLFTPRGSQAVRDEEWVLAQFGYEPRPATTFFEVTEGGNMLTKESLLFMMEMHEWLLSQSTIVDGANTTYEVVCARYSPTDGCRSPRSVLAFWDHNMTLLESDPDPLATINTANWRTFEPSGPPVTHYLGSPVYDAAGRLTSARAARISYLLKNEKEEISGVGVDDPQSRYFELAVAERASARRQQDLADRKVGAYLSTLAEAEEAGGAAVEEDIANLLVGYIIMTLYTMFILSRSRPKYSHSVLGLVSVVSVALSTFSAYGFCWYVGVKFNGVVQVLILVLLGVGIDDTFVIMDSWWDCAHITDMRERMIAAVRHAGPAITITSMTDLVAFLAGSSTVIPGIRDFCYYAAVGILFDFMFQITFVVAVAYLDSVRQARSRADVLCCVAVGDDTGVCLGDTETRAQWTESQRGLQGRVVGTHLPRLTLGTVYGKAAVVVVSLALLSVGIYGCTELKMNLNEEWFVPEGHAFREVMRVRDTYFGGNELPANAYFGALDYPNDQGTVLRAAEALRGNKWVVANSTSSWLEDFQAWVRGHPTHGMHWDATARQVTPSEFYRLLRVFASTNGPRSAWQHIDNVRWNGAGDRLVASRSGFSIVRATQTDGEAAVDAMDDLRGALRGLAAPWAGAFVYWESYKVIVEEITRNVAIAASCVFVLVSVMIANIQLGFLVTLAIGCVDVCMLGFMPIVGVELNGISVVFIVLAVGLSVDYSVHIAGAFLHKSCDDSEMHSGRTQRAAYAVWKMGPAVVNGGLSTWLAVMPAGFATSYVFKVFFRMFTLIVFFGQLFGVFLLPVLLSWAGPDPYCGAPPLNDRVEENPLYCKQLDTTPVDTEMAEEDRSA